MNYVIAILFVLASFSLANNVTFEDAIFQVLPQKTTILARSACSIGTYKDTIFILGGFLENFKIDGTIWAYNMKTDSWGIVCKSLSLTLSHSQQCPNPCTTPYTLFPIAGACSVQSQDTIYIFGGFLNESGKPNSNLYAYNMSSNALSVLSDFNHTKVTANCSFF